MGRHQMVPLEAQAAHGPKRDHQSPVSLSLGYWTKEVFEDATDQHLKISPRVARLELVSVLVSLQF